MRVPTGKNVGGEVWLPLHYQLQGSTNITIMQFSLINLSCAGALLAVTTQIHAQQSYRVDFLEGAASVARAINNAGQIVGFASDAPVNNPGYAAVWTNGYLTKLGTLDGYANSRALAISEAGQIAGVAEGVADYSMPDSRPVTWSNGTTVDASNGTSYIGRGGAATGINKQGLVVISAFGSATVWDGQTKTNLSGDNESLASAINDQGQVAGALVFGGRTQAALWTGNTPTLLPELNPNLSYNASMANALNEQGVVAGQALTCGTLPYCTAVYHATLWQDGQAIDLGALSGNRNGNTSYAYGINAGNLVVGSSETTYGGLFHAMLWDGGMIDLNSLLDPALMEAGWVLTAAYDINDHGWIVGSAENPLTGAYRGFVMTPVPEAGAFTMMAMGLMTVGAVIRRRKGFGASLSNA